VDWQGYLILSTEALEDFLAGRPADPPTSPAKSLLPPWEPPKWDPPKIQSMAELAKEQVEYRKILPKGELEIERMRAEVRGQSGRDEQAGGVAAAQAEPATPPKRRVAQRARVEKALQELFPDGVPGPLDLSNVELCRAVQGKMGSSKTLTPSDDTILRAAGRR
jgi:hypothetical protein